MDPLDPKPKSALFSRVVNPSFWIHYIGQAVPKGGSKRHFLLISVFLPAMVIISALFCAIIQNVLLLGKNGGVRWVMKLVHMEC